MVPAPTAEDWDGAAPPPPLVAAAAPTGWGGFRHSRPLGSYGSLRPGGSVGRAGMGGRVLVGPGVPGVESAGIAPVAAATAEGLAGDAADAAPTGLRGGVAGDGSISAEEDVVLRDPVADRGAAGGAPGARRPAGVGDAEDGRCGRNGGKGAGTAGPPARKCEPPKERARPPRPPGGRHVGPGCRGQRAEQATADRAPRGGCSAMRAERSLPLVCNDRFAGLDMHGRNYPHWLVTARVNFLSGNCVQSTVSALSGQRATTVGGTVFAGK